MNSIYFINPSADFPTYMGLEVYSGWGLKPATMMADLTIPTLAGMVPNDFEITLCDENISEIDFNTTAEVIGITGKITQTIQIVKIAKEFKKRNKLVMIGGPHASLSPDLLRPYCDILVQGEMENIYAQLFKDIRECSWKSEYIGDRPNLSHTPMPRWDLYPNDRAVMATLQTSRGCPFECDFCDVIQYLGRAQRHKPVATVIDELDRLYSLGYRYAFIADDNFTVYRKYAKELLIAIKDWNLKQTDGRFRFVAQVSIDAAKDIELLRMCSESGITQVFIGIETPNEASLKESGKKQNLKINLIDEVQKFLDAGICVTGGMMVGFDSDDKNIFKQQYDFAMRSSIPIFTIGALVAPVSTPLYARLSAANRLRTFSSEVPAVPWDTNIIPLQMSHRELIAGMRWLCNKLYSPEAFLQRVVQFMDKIGQRRDPRTEDITRWGFRSPRHVENESFKIIHKISKMLGRKEEKMWKKIYSLLIKNPEHIEFVLPMMVQYCQIRFMYNQGKFWNQGIFQRGSEIKFLLNAFLTKKEKK